MIIQTIIGTDGKIKARTIGIKTTRGDLPIWNKWKWGWDNSLFPYFVLFSRGQNSWFSISCGGIKKIIFLCLGNGKFIWGRDRLGGTLLKSCCGASEGVVSYVMWCVLDGIWYESSNSSRKTVPQAAFVLVPKQKLNKTKKGSENTTHSCDRLGGFGSTRGVTCSAGSDSLKPARPFLMS